MPEIASRMQLETITQVADCAIKEAKIKFKRYRSGQRNQRPRAFRFFIGRHIFCQGSKLRSGIPLLGVNHLYSHIYANFLKSGKAIPLPFVALIVSGGHTSLFYVKDFDKIELLGLNPG